jgi:hypothetical protein
MIAAVHGVSGASAACDYVWAGGSPPTAICGYGKATDAVFEPATTIAVSGAAGSGSVPAMAYARSDTVAVTSGTRFGMFPLYLPADFFKIYKGSEIGFGLTGLGAATACIGPDYENGFLLCIGGMGNKATTGNTTVTVGVAGMINSAVPAGDNADMDLIVTLERGYISTEFYTPGVSATYDTVKRLSLSTQVGNNSGTIQFKTAKKLTTKDYLLHGINASRAFEAGSFIRIASCQFANPLTTTFPASAGDLSSYLCAMSHANTRAMTLDVTTTDPLFGTLQGGTGAWLLNFGNQLDGKFAELPNLATYKPFPHESIYVPTGSFTANTVTTLLAAMQDHYLLDDAEPIDFQHRWARPLFPANPGKENQTYADTAALMSYFEGPRQEHFYPLIHNGSTSPTSLKFNRAGIINGADTSTLPTYLMNNTKCTLVYSYSNNRFFFLATAPILKNKAVSEDDVIDSFQPRDIATGDIIPGLSYNHTSKTLYDTSGIPWVADWRLGYFRKLTTTSSFPSGLTSIHCFKGSFYGLKNGNQFSTSSLDGLNRDCSGIIEGGYGTQSHGGGWTYNIATGSPFNTNAYNLCVTPKYQGVYITSDGTSTVGGGYTFGHELAGVNSGFSASKAAAYTWAYEPPATYPVPDINGSGWNDYGNNVYIGFQYFANTTYRSANGGPWTYVKTDTTLSPDVRMQVWKIHGSDAAARAEKFNAIAIQFCAYNYGGLSYGVSGVPTEHTPVTVDLKYAFTSDLSRSNIESLMTGGGSSLYSFTASQPTSADECVNKITTVSYDGSPYLAIWCHSNGSFPDAPHVPPVQSPPPSTTPPVTSQAGGNGWVTAQVHVHPRIVGLKNGFTVDDGSFTSIEPDYSAWQNFFDQNTGTGGINQKYGYSDSWAIEAPAWMQWSEVYPRASINTKPTYKLYPKTNPRRMIICTDSALWTSTYSTNNQSLISVIQSRTEPDKLYLTSNLAQGSDNIVPRCWGMPVDPGEEISFIHLSCETGVITAYNLNHNAGSVELESGGFKYKAKTETGYDAIIAHDDFLISPGHLPLQVTERSLGVAADGVREDCHLYYMGAPEIDDDTVNPVYDVSTSPVFISPRIWISFLRGYIAWKITHPNGGTTTGFPSSQTSLPVDQAEMRFLSTGGTNSLQISGNSADQWLGTMNVKTYDNSVSGTLLEDKNWTVWTVQASKTEIDPNLAEGDSIDFTRTDGKKWQPRWTRAMKIQPWAGSGLQSFKNWGYFPLAMHSRVKPMPYWSTNDEVTWTLHFPPGYRGLQGAKLGAVIGKAINEDKYGVSKKITAKPIVTSTGSAPTGGTTNGQAVQLNFGTLDVQY